MNGASINGNNLATELFLLAGEYVLLNSEQFTRDQILAAKDLFEAFNECDDEEEEEDDDEE